MPTPYDVLVFSKTAGFRHDAIPAGIQAIRDLGAANDFTVTATEDANAFTTANLAQYEAVVFLSTTGDVLNATQQTAFESYIRGGGGYVGVHAAADTEYDWPFYGELVGACFASHPAIQQATVRSRGPGARRHRAPAADLDPHRRVVQLPHQPPSDRARAGHPGREHVLRRRHGRRPPDHLVQDLQTAAARSTPARAHPGVVRRSGLPGAPARRHPVRGRPVQRRLPPGDRLHHALQRIDHRLVAGRAGQLHQHRRHAHLDRRHGPALVQRQAVHLVLAEARLEAGRRRQLRRVHRVPAVDRPVVGGEQRLRDPDRRHRRRGPHHRRGLHLQVGRHRRPRRGAEPAGRVEHLRAAGRGRAAAGLPQRREDQRLHQHRPGPLAGRPHRHPEPRRPATTRRSATSGSRNWAAPTRTRWSGPARSSGWPPSAWT